MNEHEQQSAEVSYYLTPDEKQFDIDSDGPGELDYSTIHERCREALDDMEALPSFLHAVRLGLVTKKQRRKWAALIEEHADHGAEGQPI